MLCEARVWYSVQGAAGEIRFRVHLFISGFQSFVVRSLVATSWVFVECSDWMQLILCWCALVTVAAAPSVVLAGDEFGR